MHIQPPHFHPPQFEKLHWNLQRDHLCWQPTPLFVGPARDTISPGIFSRRSSHQEEKRNPAQMWRLMKQGFLGELSSG